MRVDDPSQRRFVGLGPDVGVRGPYQLIAGDALARRRHAREPEISGVRKDYRQKRALVLAPFAGAQVSESGGQPGRPADFMHHLGDSSLRQHGVDAGC